MRPFFDAVKVIDLTDIYPTREEHKHAAKKIGQCAGGICALSLLTGLLFAVVAEQSVRIDDLEKELHKKNETAERRAPHGGD